MNYIEYDYEEAYQEQLQREDAELVDRLRRKGVKTIYATKRIEAGDQVEIEVYPEFAKKSDVPAEGLKKNYNPKVQRNLKDRNARKHCERLINENFSSQDVWITLTYSNENLPKSMEDAQKNMQRYIKRLAYHRQKLGLPKNRYIYVTEWSDDGEKIRCHHHVVMDGALSMDDIEKAWKLGRRNETRRLDYDENGLSGLAKYITKDPKGKKRWCASKNLKKPREYKSHSKFSSRKVERMAKDYEQAVEMITKTYPECWFKSLERRYNNVNGKFYIYAKLRRKCVPGDLVYVRDAESIGLDSSTPYELKSCNPDGTAIIRKAKGRSVKADLKRLHLAQKKRRNGSCSKTKRQNNRP